VPRCFVMYSCSLVTQQSFVSLREKRARVELSLTLFKRQIEHCSESFHSSRESAQRKNQPEDCIIGVQRRADEREFMPCPCCLQREIRAVSRPTLAHLAT